MASIDETYSLTGYEPNAYDFKETYVESYTELLTSPPFLSKQGFPEDAEYDDALEDMLREAHRVHVHHSQREDLSVGQSSSVSERTERPVGDRSWQHSEHRSSEAQIRIGWVLPYFSEGPVKNPSVRKESLTWIVSRIRSARGRKFGRVIEEFETMDASEVYSKRLHAKEVIFPKENGKSSFQSRMDESNLLEEIRNWEHPPWYGITQFEERVAAFTLNQESNFTRREKNHSLFHWNTLTFPELLIRIGILSKKAASMITGISMGQEICLILGQVSLSLLY